MCFMVSFAKNGQSAKYRICENKFPRKLAKVGNRENYQEVTQNVIIDCRNLLQMGDPFDCSFTGHPKIMPSQNQQY